MAAAEEPISRSDFQAMNAETEFRASGDPFWDNEDYRWFRPYNVVRGADGVGVLLFLLVLFGVSYALKKEFWKDIK